MADCTDKYINVEFFEGKVAHSPSSTSRRGSVVLSSIGQVVNSSNGQLVKWSIRQNVNWSSGQFVKWSIGQLILIGQVVESTSRLSHRRAPLSERYLLVLRVLLGRVSSLGGGVHVHWCARFVFTFFYRRCVFCFLFRAVDAIYTPHPQGT